MVIAKPDEGCLILGGNEEILKTIAIHITTTCEIESQKLICVSSEDDEADRGIWESGNGHPSIEYGCGCEFAPQHKYGTKVVNF